MRGILVLTRTLGDVVLGNVLAKNIKLQYPDIKLDYVVEEGYKDLIVCSPHISKVIQIKNTREGFDHILTLVSSKEYEHVFFAQQTSVVDNNWHQYEDTRHQHLIDFYASRCGVKLIDRKLELTSDENIVLNVKDYKRPVIVMHNRTLADVKNWSYFGELAKRYVDSGATVLQFGKGDEDTIENAIKESYSLSEIMAFFDRKRCDMFVGLDSGLTYVAAAFNVPTISIQGATVSETSGAYGDNVLTLVAEQNDKCRIERRDIRCHGILNGVCKYGEKCIDTFTAERVFSMSKGVLHGKVNY